MSVTPVTAFIFDLDGVITDTAEFHYLAWKRLADEEGISFTRKESELLRGVSRRESLNRLLQGRSIDEAAAQAWMERKNDYYRDFLKQITPQHALPGVPQFLREARMAGLKLGLGSASKNAHEVLKRLGLTEAFDAIGDGYSVINTKPAPDIFIWVAGRLGVPPSEAVVFEDAEAGIDAALQGGFRAVGLGRSTIQRAHLVAPDGLEKLDVQTVLANII
jgi:beta-phosphoglucomutase